MVRASTSLGAATSRKGKKRLRDDQTRTRISAGLRVMGKRQKGGREKEQPMGTAFVPCVGLLVRNRDAGTESSRPTNVLAREKGATRESRG
jgi:hypothetical protein